MNASAIYCGIAAVSEEEEEEEGSDCLYGAANKTESGLCAAGVSESRCRVRDVLVECAILNEVEQEAYVSADDEVVAIVKLNSGHCGVSANENVLVSVR